MSVGIGSRSSDMAAGQAVLSINNVLIGLALQLHTLFHM